MPQFGLYAGTPVAHVRTSLADFKKNDVCATRGGNILTSRLPGDRFAAGSKMKRY